MNAPAESARDDLAFLRALVENPGRSDTAAGRFFLATGLIWAFDALVFWLHYAGLITLTQTQMIVFVAAVTLVWLPLAIWLRWGAPPKSESPAVGAAARAYGVAAAAIGAVAAGTLAVFLVATIRLGVGEVFVVYPSMMFLCFGAMWLAAYVVVRRVLRLGVALGWFAAAIAMAAAPGPLAFVAIAGLSMLLLMALPGAIMMRTAAKDA
jgi:hypothetical protein